MSTSENIWLQGSKKTRCRCEYCVFAYQGTLAEGTNFAIVNKNKNRVWMRVSRNFHTVPNSAAHVLCDFEVRIDQISLVIQSRAWNNSGPVDIPKVLFNLCTSECWRDQHHQSWNCRKLHDVLVWLSYSFSSYWTTKLFDFSWPLFEPKIVQMMDVFAIAW